MHSIKQKLYYSILNDLHDDQTNMDMEAEKLHKKSEEMTMIVFRIGSTWRDTRKDTQKCTFCGKYGQTKNACYTKQMNDSNRKRK